jgi:hypothetical protein
MMLIHHYKLKYLTALFAWGVSALLDSRSEETYWVCRGLIPR